MARNTKKPPIPRPKLLPCPCCGGRPTWMEEHGAKSIACMGCGLHTTSEIYGSFLQTSYEAEHAVAERWNRRA